MDKFIRNMTDNEKFYTILQEISSTFSIQYIIEGKGKIDRTKFETAVEEASKYCIGSKMKAKKNFWIECNTKVKINYIKNNKFDGYNFEELNIFKDKINPYENTTEIYVIESDITRIIFKIFHGAMDGKGSLIWVKNIFKALKSEKIVETDVFETDINFIKNMEYKKYKNKLKFDIKIYNEKNKKLKEYNIYWKRLKIDKNIPAITAKIIKILNEYFDNEKNRFLVPVDLRRHKKDICSTSNLTMPLFLDTYRGESWEDINNRLIDELNQNKEININNAEINLIKKLPKYILKFYLKKELKKRNEKSEFMIGAIVSNLGKIDLNDFKVENFEAEKFYSLPVHQPFSPLSIVVSETKDTTEILFSAYKEIIDTVKMYNIMKKIKKEIEFDIDYEKINNTKKDYSNYKFVYDLIEQESLKNPEKIALICGKEILNYKEIITKSNQIGLYLYKKGVKKGERVIILLERNIDFILSILSVVKIGAVYIPMENKTNIEKIKKIIQDIKNIKIITNKKNKEILKNNQINNLFDYEEIKEKSNKYIDKKEKIINESKENDIIYQIYTSGTTGTPKGIEIDNKNLRNYILWAKECYKTDNDTRFALFTSMAVDLTITALFLPLISGGSIEIFPEETDHFLLKKIVENKNINSLKLTPTHLKIIIESNKDISEKKLVVVGGEQFDIETAKKTKKIFGENVVIVNEYGPTETTVGCMYHKFDDNKNYKEKVLPIGYPINNTKIYAVDENLEIIKNNNKEGQLIVCGDGIAKSYYNNEKLNNEKFINIFEEKAYLTGDIVKFNGNEFVYIGRKDKQIKISGNRVELGEIEAEISKIDGIKNCVAINRESENKNVLIAYYTSEKYIDEEKIKEILKKNIPMYMIPSFFKKIDEIPVLNGGKIDIKSLPEIKYEKNKLELNISQEKKYNLYEKEILEICNYILKEENKKIDIFDNIIEYADSLNIIRIFTEIVKKFQMDNEKEKKLMKFKNEIISDFTVYNLSKIINRLY